MSASSLIHCVFNASKEHQGMNGNLESTMSASRQVSQILMIGIMFFPVIFAWFTLRSGYSWRARGMALGWLVLSIMISIVLTP